MALAPSCNPVLLSGPALQAIGARRNLGRLPVEWTTQSVMAGGHRLHVELLGQLRSGTATLVFLHEGLGSVAQWRDFPSELSRATGLPAVVYDRWGFGRSEPLHLPRPDTYLNLEAEQALPDLLRGLRIERPILVGHSDGATIALLFAAAFPHWPVACISEAAHVIVEDVTIAGIRAAAEEGRSAELKARLHCFHGAKTDLVFRGWTETWLRPSFRHWSMVQDLPRIACPVLALQGEDDEYGTPRQVALIKDGVSGACAAQMIPDCGHTPHFQARVQAARLMVGFIERVSNGTLARAEN